MMLHRRATSSPSPALLGAVVCSLIGFAAGPVGRAPASEVISAIPGQAKPPISPAMVVETIEAGTRGPMPAPARRGCVDECRGATCPHGHCKHAGCRHGACGVPGCPAHCPVRPASFGFYGTQWRSWPGHDVVQAAHAEPAAPVMPPKSEVPSADEESPVPGFELPAPEPDAAPETEPEAAPETEPAAAPEKNPAAAPAPEPAPSEQQPTARAPLEPAPLPVPDDRPKAAPPVAPNDDNLFDEAASRRRGQERLAMLRQAALHQERLRHEALRQLAPRVARPYRPLQRAVYAEPAPGEPGDASEQAAPLNPLR